MHSNAINVACLTQESPSLVEPFACNLCQLENIGRVDVFYHDYWDPEDLQDKDMIIIIPNSSSLLLSQDIAHYAHMLTKISCKGKMIITMAIQPNITAEVLAYLEELRDVAKQYGATAHLHYGKAKNFNENIKYLFNSITQHKQPRSKNIHKESWMSRLNTYFWTPTA